ncbi:DUF4347 domain-containing protein [Aeromonas media]|uniref:DUF4347 domain-containing protein n=4 Tax=Aeromonas TaxID=642 RepID=UPI000444D008|nr:DUF4347 domain-containing protein [Aeromonas media]AHX62637.1 rhizobiocin/RTX toxin and hemolysin-type calcium binding protein [Aeromonas media WS]
MSTQSIVFIDSRVTGYETLIASLGTDTEWYLLDANQDGVDQMQRILAGHTDLDSIQVISHGSVGTLYLGNTALSSDNLSSYQTQLQAIGSSLADTGDILLYGCNVAQGDTGTTFVNSLAQLTKADVAVSDNITGLGSDWRLEHMSGNIDESPFDGAAYQGSLQLIRGTEGNDRIVGDGLDNTIYGYGGDDWIDGEAAHDLIYGGDGADTIDGNFGNDTLWGGLGDDVLTDSQGTNQLYGEAGNDRLTANALTGSHLLDGGLGNDTIDGVGASMVLLGGDGSDELNAHGNLYVNSTTTYVQHGQATISGGAGDDGYYEYQSWNGSGYETVGNYMGGLSAAYMADVLLQGDDGRDNLNVAYSKTARLEGGAGADSLSAYAYGYALKDIGESYGVDYQLDGGADDDSLEVTSSAYRGFGRIDLSLEGGTGNDQLKVSTHEPGDANYGIASAVLSGGDGDDRLEANGVLQLTLSGGSGKDTFVLTAQQYQAQQKGTMQFNLDSTWNNVVDVTARPMEITDFVAGISGDVLDIQDLLRNGAVGFDGSNPFGSSGYLRLIQSDTSPADALLQFDVNGGGDDYVTLAVLKNVTASNLVGANFNPAYPTDGSELPGLVFDGTAAADTLLGSAGGDTISGFAGDDVINGDAGYDSIFGGDGADTIDGNFGNDTLWGGLGDDVLTDSQGTNQLYGEAGNDRLTANALTGSHLLDGGLGNDTIDGVGASMVLLGGDGSDELNAHGNLYVNSTTTYVQHGQATISGGAGDDGYYEYQSWNGSGYETVGNYMGGLSAAYMADVLLQGDDGRDNLNVAYSKTARLEGGAGADSLSAYAYGYALKDIGESYGVDYQLDGGADDDSLEVTSSAYRGFGRIDLSLEGGTGNDQLKVSTHEPGDANYGIASAVLSGGDGDDRLEANGVLQLTLSGGSGKDTFVLTAQQYQAQQKGTMQFNLDSTWNNVVDVTARPMEITDFVAGISGDVLDIQDLLRNGAVGFDGSNPFGSSGYLRLIQSDTSPADALLQFDVNGGGDDYVTLAVLKNVTASNLVGANFNPAYPTDGSELPGLVFDGTAAADTLLGSAGGDTISGFAGDDVINGDAGYDSIFGGDGADTIDGNFGNDTLWGGLGDDVLTDSQGTNQLYGEAGNDRLTANALTGSHLLDGGLGNDTIDGVGASMVLLGGDGSDELNAHGNLYVNSTTTYVQHGQATISGGAGDDGYYEYQSWNGSGYETVGNYMGGLSAAYMADVLLQGDDGRDNLNVAYSKTARLEGGAGADSLSAYAYGYALKDIGESYGVDYQLDGGADDDSLEVTSSAYRGFGRIDLSLEGGTGNDQLKVSTHEPGDANYGIASAVLSGGDGDDRLEANGVLQLTLSGGSGKDTFVLTAQQYQAQQKGTMQFNLDSTWNNVVDVTARPMEITDFVAGWGGEKLDIRDLMQNGASNYDGTNPFKSGHLDVVKSGDDTLLKFDADGGGDNYVTLAVLKGVKWTELVAQNFSPLFGTPNGDIMSGLGGSNRHYGMGSNDIMVTMDAPAGDPNWDSHWDTLASTQPVVVEDNILDGGEGADSMAGGGGNDTYYVDNLGDIVKEVAGQGADKVITSIDYVLSGNVENLDIGTDAVKGTMGTGNALDNIMRANDKGSELDSGDGNDQVYGGKGNDQVHGGKGNDKLYAGSGDDWVDAGEGDDEIVGGDGAGNDTYVGGIGIDTVRYTSAITGITVDLALGTASGNEIGSDQLSEIENIIGGQSGDTLKGTSEANSIDGYTGSDTLIGGLGNDSYYVDLSTDIVVENLNEGTDTVFSTAAAFTLSANVDNGRINTSGAANLTGNSLNNTLYAGVGNNVLDGGVGADTASYAYATAGVTASLASAVAQATGGSGSDTLLNIENLTGSNYNDSLTGNSAANTLDGGAGNDMLDGGLGNDQLLGGAGNDTYVVDSTLDVISETSTTATDIDTVQSAVSWTLGNNLENLVLTGTGAINGVGNALANTLTGNSAANTLDGGAGADRLTGGDGSDSYYVDNTGDVVSETNAVLASGGTDTVNSYLASYTLGANVENLRLLAAGAANGTGNGLNNVIYAGAGNNVLDGGAGADTASYAYATAGVTASLASAVAQATGGSGSDTLLNIENLTGSNYNDSLTGNSAANTLDGGAGNDMLDGGLGNDQLLGGAGNDTYVVDSTLDVISETSTTATDIDTVQSAVSWTLGNNLENLVLTGTGAINGVGNALANTLTGNSAANTLDGGAGADRLTGGDGSDSYYVDNTGDVVSETNAVLASGGTDTVNSYLASYTLGANVENLRLLAAGAANGTGNGLNNVIYAGAGNNVLDGGAGADTASYAYATAGVTASLASAVAQATGGSGSDTLLNIENLTGSNYNDSLTGNSAANTLDGGAGNDMLDGGLGNDQLLGGAGNDTYVVDSTLDVISETSTTATDIDTVQSAVSWTLGNNLENLVLTGTGAINGVGNALANTLTGNSAANTLDGGAGADRLTGGDGSDSYYVDNTGDVVSETNAVLASGGTDTVNSYLASYTLGANVENLRLLAAGAANGTGNGLNNVIYAGAGNNVLDGGAGADTASYAYATAGVTASLASAVAQATGGSGSDTLLNIENLTGSNYNDSLTGNSAANTLDGGAGNDMLDGGLGNDQLLGGAGNDTYVVDSTLDVISETSTTATDIDTVQSAVSWTLGNNLENLVLTGTGAINGVGNALANTLTGNSAANTLDGGAGADRLTGGDGSDSYYVDNTGDVVSETNAVLASGGTDTVNSYLASYTLGANVENLRLLATGAANGTGNGLNNVLYAGAGNNVLDGGTGADTASYAYATAGVTVSLVSTVAQATGGSGSDTLLNIENLTGSNYNDSLTGNSAANTLNGGAGADRLTGGDGSDSYYVDNTGDVVNETNAVLASGGTDTVNSYLASYTLGANVENLRLLAAGAANGTGNGLNNVLYAGTGNNVLDGGAGADTASYAYATAGVTVSLTSTVAQATGGSGSDKLLNIEHLSGSNYNDSLTGNNGDNILNGGAGADRMSGNHGSDIYYVDNIGDTVVETMVDPTGGADTVYSYLADYTLGTYVENLRLLATGAANGNGNSNANTIYAGAGNNVMDGRTGSDTVSYAYATAGVTASLASSLAQATGGSGSDTLLNFEHLTGSNYNDTLTGNSAANTLNGGAGADRLTGGDGSDNYYVDNIGDVVSETNAVAASGGTDTVFSTATAFTLSANVEDLRLLASGAANGTGNSLSNTLYAGAGNNVLDGGAGTDTASYALATAGVTASLASAVAQATGGSGSDTLLNIENLTGSNYNDTLTGNSGANSLNGGTGADVLTGGDGSDSYYVDNIGDVVSETNAVLASGGTDMVNSYLAAYTLGANVENLRLLAAGAANGTGNSLNNTLYAGAGTNVLDGGAGADTVSYTYATAGVTVSLASTVAQATGGSGSDTLLNIEHLAGSNYNDTLTGNSGANTLIGGLGRDVLTGNGGNDIFDFNALSEMGVTGTTWDVITDFTKGDRLDLSTLDANTGTSANDAFSSVNVGGSFSGTFTTGTGTLYFDSANHVLYGNADADSTAEFAIQLNGVAALSATDFIL